VFEEAPSAPVAEAPKMRRRPRARAAAATINADPVAETAPKSRRGRKPRPVETADETTMAPEPVVSEVPVTPEPQEQAAPDPVAAEPARKPARRRREAVADATMDEVGATPAETLEASAPKPKRARRKASDTAVEPAAVEEAPAKVAKPRGRPRKAAVIEAGDAAPTSEVLAAPVETTPPQVEVQPQDADAPGTNDDPDGAPRRGWWQRTFG